MSKITLITLLISTLASLAIAQTIDPSSVDDATKSHWCTDQKTSCPLLCNQVASSNGKKPKENRCDPDTLSYSCICSNGQVPNASEISQTIPFYECQTTQDNCVANCNGQTACQSSCREDHPCGAQNPTRVNTSTMTGATAAATSFGGSDATATGDFSGFGGAASTSGTSDAARQIHVFAVGYGRLYGLVTVLAGVFAGFMLL